MISVIKQITELLFNKLKAPIKKDQTELFEAQLIQNYLFFCEMSEKKDIESIEFCRANSIISLNDGRKYFFNPSNSVARMYTVPSTGTFESKETQYIKNIIKPGSICVDVGANFGWYTILLSKLTGPNGHVIAFEPIPSTFEILKKNVILNDCSNVKINQIALDKENSQKILFIPDIGVSGSLKLHEYKNTYQTFQCQTISLDNYCTKNNIHKVDFIKADIEGAEWLMLQGAIDLIKQNKPVLLLEIQAQSTKLFDYEPKDIINWLVDLEYVVYYIENNGDLKIVNDYTKLPDYNFIFLQKNRLKS